MENISNQLSYLKGLVDGIKVDPESEYGRIFEGIINVLDEINESVNEILDYQDELSEQIDLIDEDLAIIEEEFADEDDFEDDDFNDWEYYEIDCPKCGATVCLDEDFFDTDKSVVCPECGEEFDIDFDTELEDEE
ncbi:MAG: hypothetical protein E7394_07640 [Ruminococcaceae bacterium]|nr:hypothetical protein [Oscillospiraceae bacterium]